MPAEEAGLKYYHVSFWGRLKGSIGRFGNHGTYVLAADEELGRLALYDEWDHIECPKFVELTPEQVFTREMHLAMYQPKGPA